MKARTLRIGLVASVVASSIVVRATTWAPKEVVCPICKTRNVFKTVASAGSYIYNWPSKYQYIFWPATDRAVVYCCRKCRLSAFMWDFERIPDGKLDDVRRALEGARIEGTYDDYLKIPMSERLQIAEKVYSALERDERSWCEFYRVLAYHLDEEKLPARADQARRKALGIAERMAGEKKNAGILKELLLITGAMRHLLKDDAGALADFERARALTYQDLESGAEAAGLDRYLSELLKEYSEKVRPQPRPAR